MRGLVSVVVVLAGCADGASRPDVVDALQARSDEDVVARFGDDGRLASFTGSFAIRGAPEDGAVALLDELVPALGLDGSTFAVERVREGLTGTYVRMTEVQGDFPVLDGDAVVRVDGDQVVAGNLDLQPVEELDPAVVASADEAVALARSLLGADEVEALEPTVETGWLSGARWGEDGRFLVHRVSEPVVGGADWRVIVDARTGELLDRQDARQFATGSGYVFDPNPEAATGQTNLHDNNDADSATLTAARTLVTLSRLDGSGYLRGTWVDARRNNRANEPTLTFDYTRSDDRFEEVQSYFHLDRAQDHLQQLGFTNVNAHQQVVLVDGSRIDNAWYSPSTREITTGTGGVDDAEDADVIVHEYGHAIQDDQGSWNYGDAPAMGEGFGDYWSSSVINGAVQVQNDPLCMGEWDASAFGMACIRRLDSDHHYPERWSSNDPHTNGEIWSAGLWRARDQVGGDVMDTIVIESQFAVPANPTVEEATDAILTAAENLYGHDTREAVKRALIQQGLSRELSPESALTQVQSTVNTVLTHARDAQHHYANDADLEATYTSPGAGAVQAHFVGVETEAGYDYVYVYDAAGNLYQVIDGTQVDFWSAKIPGDTIRIRLVSDGGVTKRGFYADSVNVY